MFNQYSQVADRRFFNKQGGGSSINGNDLNKHEVGNQHLNGTIYFDLLQDYHG